MKFSTRRVAVFGEGDQFIRRVHPRAALVMIALKQATAIDKQSIKISGGLSLLPRSERDVRRPSTTSIKTTWRQRLECGGHLLQHKRIEDASLYGLRSY